MRSRLAVATLLALMAFGSMLASADDATITATIPTDCSPGVTISLDVVMVPVNGGDTIPTNITSQSVVPGEEVVAEATGLDEQEDYEAVWLAMVTYPSGNTELCEWSCLASAEWFNCHNTECRVTRH